MILCPRSSPPPSASPSLFWAPRISDQLMARRRHGFERFKASLGVTRGPHGTYVRSDCTRARNSIRLEPLAGETKSAPSGSWEPQPEAPRRRLEARVCPRRAPKSAPEEPREVKGAPRLHLWGFLSVITSLGPPQGFLVPSKSLPLPHPSQMHNSVK